MDEKRLQMKDENSERVHIKRCLTLFIKLISKDLMSRIKFLLRVMEKYVCLLANGKKQMHAWGNFRLKVIYFDLTTI